MFAIGYSLGTYVTRWQGRFASGRSGSPLAPTVCWGTSCSLLSPVFIWHGPIKVNTIPMTWRPRLYELIDALRWTLNYQHAIIADSERLNVIGKCDRVCDRDIRTWNIGISILCNGEFCICPLVYFNSNLSLEYRIYPWNHTNLRILFLQIKHWLVSGSCGDVC